jgi:hypothetical protein
VRFYNVEDGAPVFPGRDGVLYPKFEAMAAKNELRYDFYTTVPSSIVTNGRSSGGRCWRRK